MTVAEKMTETQERMLTGMGEAQGRMLEMNQRMAETVVGLMPKNEMFKMASLPGMDDMPRPAELVDSYFDFAAKMADANRSFYKEMVSIWAPKEAAEPTAPAKATSKAKSKKNA